MPAGFDGSLMTIAGAKQTEAGNNTVTVELKDATNYEWADGTTQKLSFAFNIGAMPSGEVAQGGGTVSTGLTVAILVGLAVCLLIALIALIVAMKKSKATDSDGFYDDVTEDDLKM